MKKLGVNPPSEPVPEAYHVTKKIQAPKVKKMKSLKKIGQAYKVNNQCDVFINKIKLDLEQYDDSDLRLNFFVLADVYNKAVKTIVYGDKEDRENMQLHAVKVLMSEYFDNENNLEAFIDCIKSRPGLFKSNFLKRACKRLYNYLFLKKAN